MTPLVRRGRRPAAPCSWSGRQRRGPGKGGGSRNDEGDRRSDRRLGRLSSPGTDRSREETVSTPWGEPSDSLRFGRIGDTEAVFLARHGRGHRFSPSTINYRANIDALKRAGVTDIIALSACGSFHRELYPGVFVMIDQFVDRTHLRASTFFGTGCVAHVSMAHPIAPLLRRRLLAATEAEGMPCKEGGTYLCMEGPQFSSFAELLGHQARGADVIGMTGATEAKLAREAEISYATVAMVTDYDCWHEEHEAVDVATVIKVMSDNADKAARARRPHAARLFRRARALSDRLRPGARIRHHHPPGGARSGAGRKARRGRRPGAQPQLKRLARVSASNLNARWRRPPGAVEPMWGCMLRTWVERILFASRFLLAPLYLALAVSLLALLFKSRHASLFAVHRTPHLGR